MIGRLSPGDSFGETTVLKGLAMPCTVITDTHVHIGTISSLDVHGTFWAEVLGWVGRGYASLLANWTICAFLEVIFFILEAFVPKSLGFQWQVLNFPVRWREKGGGGCQSPWFPPWIRLWVVFLLTVTAKAEGEVLMLMSNWSFCRFGWSN